MKAVRLVVLVTAVAGIVAPALDAQVESRSLFGPNSLQHLSSLSSDQFEAKPDISHDLLTLHFASAQAGGVGDLDVWVTTRPSPRDPFGTASNVLELNSTGRDHTPTTNADGTLIIFSSSRPGTGSDDAWMSTRADASQPWTFPPTEIAQLNSVDRDMGFSMTPDALCLYYTSDRGNIDGTFDLYMSTRATTNDAWGAPTPVAELNTQWNDKFPSVTGDNLTMYFASDRPGSVPDPDNGNAPSLDLWVAMRPDTSSPWTLVENVYEVNTQYGEYLMSIADDESELFFVSNRPSSLGSFDLYRVNAIRGVRRYGEGTVGSAGVPRMRTLGGAPIVGNGGFGFEITQVSADHQGLWVLGFDAFGGPLLVDLAPPTFVLEFQPAAAGNPPPPTIPLGIPNDPLLVDVTLRSQTIIVGDPSGGAQVGSHTIAASPGVEFTILP